MALHLSISHQSWTSRANPITSSSDPTHTRCSMPGTTGFSRRVEFRFGSSRTKGVVAVNRKEGLMRGQVIIRASLETSVDTQVDDIVGKVTQVNKDTFWPIVNAAGNKIVVLDMFTQWCGPCKAMAPKYEKLAEENLDIVFLKLDCNQENKSLAKELGIKVVPTFKILKDGKVVNEVTGAKFDALVAAIQSVQSS